MSALALAHAPWERFAAFVDAFGTLVDMAGDEAIILRDGATLLADLMVHDDWLPDAYAAPDPRRYRQYLLHRDPGARFSIVSFVWGPGQATPVHDHTVWGLVGVLRGAELVERFVRDAQGELVSAGPLDVIEAGQVDAVSPRIGDVHRVANAHRDRVSVSIHVYGADIGRIERSTYDADGRPSRFVSGYAETAPLIP